MKTTRYSREVKERAVRMVFEHRGDYPSQWAAIESIAPKIGCTTETLRGWVRRHERDVGLRDGMTTADRARIQKLEREVRELANEILRLASAFFAQAELDRLKRKRGPSSIGIGRLSGSSRSARHCRSHLQ